MNFCRAIAAVGLLMLAPSVVLPQDFIARKVVGIEYITPSLRIHSPLFFHDG
jgi:hypothetical protein